MSGLSPPFQAQPELAAVHMVAPRRVQYCVSYKTYPQRLSGLTPPQPFFFVCVFGVVHPDFVIRVLPGMSFRHFWHDDGQLVAA